MYVYHCLAVTTYCLVHSHTHTHAPPANLLHIRWALNQILILSQLPYLIITKPAMSCKILLVLEHTLT